MKFEKCYEEGAVRAVYVGEDGYAEVKFYNSVKNLLDDISDGDIGIYPVGEKMFVFYSKHAELNREPCNYWITVEDDINNTEIKFFGKVVIVGFEPETGEILSLKDEQLEQLFRSNSVNSQPIAVRTVFRKPDAFPKVISFDSEGEIKAFFGTDDLVLTEVGDKLYAIYRADAESNGEKKNLHNEYFDGYRNVVEYIYGDVVIIGYDPKGVGVYDLSDEQLMGIMFTLENVLD